MSAKYEDKSPLNLTYHETKILQDYKKQYLKIVIMCTYGLSKKQIIKR